YFSGRVHAVGGAEPPAQPGSPSFSGYWTGTLPYATPDRSGIQAKRRAASVSARSTRRHAVRAPLERVVLSRITMKICFFHRMPYRFLPVDFERNYRADCVDVPDHLYDAAKTPGLHNSFLDELELAEAQAC